LKREGRERGQSGGEALGNITFKEGAAVSKYYIKM
jgi:hypothetical protein